MNTRKLNNISPQTIDWKNPNSIWDAHPSNHRLVPGGSEYESRYLWVKDQIEPGSWVLDVGCNCGQLAANLKADLDCNMWGIDIVMAFVRNCQQMREQPFTFVCCGDFSRSSLDDLGLPEGIFDVVTALEVIEHPIEVRGFLENVNRALRPGGRLIITTPNPASEGYGYSYLEARAHHVRMWSPLRLAMVFGPPVVYHNIYVKGELNQMGAVFQKPGQVAQETEDE